MLNNLVFDKNYSVAADVNGPGFYFPGGCLVLGAFGTFGAGTVKLQFTIDNNVTWVDLGVQAEVEANIFPAISIGMIEVMTPMNKVLTAFGGMKLCSE